MGEGSFRDREGNNQRGRERAGRERHKGRVVLMLAALPRTRGLQRDGAFNAFIISSSQNIKNWE